MKPGRELDAAVAVALGWHHMDGEYGVPPEIECLHGRMRVPRCSEDIAAAWQVIERLAELGWTTHVTVQDDGKRICHCTMWEEDEDDDEMDLVAMTEFMESDSAPHAICLAALAALEAK